MPKHSRVLFFPWLIGSALVLTGCETTSVTETSTPVSEGEVAEVLIAEESPIPNNEVVDTAMSCACEDDVPETPEPSALDLAFEAIAGKDFDAARAHFDHHGFS